MNMAMRIGSGAILAFSGAMVVAQPPRPKAPAPRDVDLRAPLSVPNYFWTHPMGEHAKLPCAHLVAEHANGDPVTVPCVHLRAEHPDGHEGPRVPCVHPKKDGNGVPILDHGRPVMEHPDGDTTRVACGHMVAEHLDGDPTGRTIPCVHMRKQHPDGDDGPMGPCVHPLAVTRTDNDLGIRFYTDNADVQRVVLEAGRKLRDFGVGGNATGMRLARKAANIGDVREGWAQIAGGNFRYLSVFNHAPDPSRPADGSNPLWSKYNGLFHGFQFMRGETRLEGTCRHEMGHAICGHTCVQPMTRGGQHSINKATEPGTAVSEGWADFVEAAIGFGRDSAAPQSDAGGAFANLETNQFINRRDGSVINDVDYGPNTEMCFAAILWDLYDTRNDGVDSISIEFSELFKVFSPSLATLSEGPAISDVNNFLERLAKNHPEKRSAIFAIRDQNIKAPSGPGKGKPGK